MGTRSVMATRIDSHEAYRCMEAGAQLLEVLPLKAYREAHLPGAVGIPLPELTAEAVASLDPSQPIVVYCFDNQCDLSARGAADSGESHVIVTTFEGTLIGIVERTALHVDR